MGGEEEGVKGALPRCLVKCFGGQKRRRPSLGLAAGGIDAKLWDWRAWSVDRALSVEFCRHCAHECAAAISSTVSDSRGETSEYVFA